MSLGTYDTHSLIKVVETIRAPSTYWLDLCFPQVQTFDTEFIDFDVLNTTRKLAPFVAPNVQGKPMSANGYTTKRFKPAYVKPKHIVDPNRVIKRMAGEAFTGSMSPAQRRNAVIADILREHKEMHIRRQEWMACQAIVNGAVTISGEDYPEVTVSFGRDNDNSVTLLTTDQWDDYTNSDPIADLQTWRLQVQAKSARTVNRVTMGIDAYSMFKDHPKVKDLLDTNYRGSADVVNRSVLGDEPAQFAGRVGNLEIWVYNDVYEADNGTVTPFMDSRRVVLTSPGIEGIRCFGAILDAKAGYQAIEMFAKNWYSEDPSVEYLMTQSAPLMVPSRPNASLSALVL